MYIRCARKLRPLFPRPCGGPKWSRSPKKGDPGRLVFDSEAVLKRVKKHGDLFEPLLTLKQRLPSPRKLDAI